MPGKLHPRVSINQLCFPGASPANCIEIADSMGAGVVTLCSPQLLESQGLALAVQTRRDRGIEVACISHTFAVHPDLENDQGSAARNLLLLIDADWVRAASRFTTLLAPCVKAASSAGVRLLVENASPLFADIHIAHSLADTIQLAQAGGIGLCTDLFYCWTEANIDANLARAATMSGLVQLGDYVPGDRSLPARAVPGDGSAPLEGMISLLLKSGYRGVFDLELLGPRIDAEGHRAATARAAGWLSGVLRREGA